MTQRERETRDVAPGPSAGTVRGSDGKVYAVPAGWELLPPGDAALTRRVKSAGDSWTVKEKKGRRTFSLGVWAPAEHIAEARAQVAEQRAAPGYRRKLDASRKRREDQQARYAVDFEREVRAFLAFAPSHGALEQALARAIAAHAVPVGSGTVARTQRIPIERRAEAATIAWLRHATTAYDHMPIPRVRGMRREVRRMLAQHSRKLLDRYRRGESVAADCPLQRALCVEG